MRFKNQPLGERVRKLRERADESLDKAGQAIGLTKAHLWEIEKGKSANPRLKTVLAMWCNTAFTRAVFLEKMPARFWSFVNRGKVNECWEWKGFRDQKGYGRFAWTINGKRTHLASRVAYLLTHGSLSDEQLVCHSCDNPPCVNPDHLWLGTAVDNALDMVRKERGRSTLTGKQVLEIRASSKPAKELANKYGVHKDTIRNVQRRKCWKHI